MVSLLRGNCSTPATSTLKIMTKVMRFLKIVFDQEVSAKLFVFGDLHSQQDTTSCCE